MPQRRLQKRCLECGRRPSKKWQWYPKHDLCRRCYWRLYQRDALDVRRQAGLPHDIHDAARQLLTEAVETECYSVDTPCWEIPVTVRCRLPRGYTFVRFRGQTHLAHRIINESQYGPFTADRPIGMHTCDRPACIRPIHLMRGNQSDNMADMVRKGRHKSVAHPSRAC